MKIGTPEEQKDIIRKLLKAIPVREHFTAPIPPDIISQVEETKWITLPNDYWWFIRNLGQGGVGSDIFGAVEVSEHIHVFHSILEAKRMEDHVPLRDFLLIEHSEDGFYYIELSPYRIEREIAPIHHWCFTRNESRLAYPNFYDYFIAHLEGARERYMTSKP